MGDADAGCTQEPCRPIVGEFPLTMTRDLDMLFVIDKSPDMADEQQALVTEFHQITDALGKLDGGLPNLHIGVISTDVGVGPNGPGMGCSETDDDGLLQATPRSACTPPDGLFIIDQANTDGTRVTNYPASMTLEDAFACIAPLGTDGCGFEQPLEAIRLALDGTRTENAGFLRPNAFLSIVILTSEDDCSAYDKRIYDGTDLTAGPVGSFRCTRWGVMCDGSEVTQAGIYSNCIPWDESWYLNAPSAYADVLRGLKSPVLTNVTVIAGPTEPFQVRQVTGTNELELVSSCTSSTGSAAPAVRLDGFADEFPGRSTFSSVCDGDLVSASAGIANLLGSVVGDQCLAGYILDTSADPGLQPDCKVFDVKGRGTPGESWTEVVSCAAQPAAKPCYRLDIDESKCPFAPGHLRVSVDRDTQPDADTLVVTCSTP